jgi:hypothetical protein
MFGVSAILSLIVLPLAQIPVLALFTPLVVVWSVLMTIIILRDAFDASILKAILIMVGMGAASVMIVMLLVPSYLPEAQQIFTAGTEATA